MASNRHISEWVSDGNGPSTVGVGLLVLLGVGLVAHPLYLWPHYGQTPYTMMEVEHVSEEAPPADAVIAYDALPDEARSAFNAARRDELLTLWSGEDDRAIEVLEDHRYIEFRGEFYRYEFPHGDNGDFVGIGRALLTAVGMFLLVLGGLLCYTNAWRPITPLRSLWIPVATTVGLVGMQTYDVLFSGVSGPLLFPRDLICFTPIATLFASTGSVVRTRGRRSVLPMVGVGVLLLVGGAAVTSAPLVVPLILGVILTVGGLPWFALGYVLTTTE